MKKRLVVCLAALLSVTGAAAARELPQYESTGTIELAIDGKQATYHSTSNTVPGQPGRLVHTANWRTFAPMILSGINMAPEGIMLSITAQPTVKPVSSAPQLRISFSLDENDRSLLDDTPFEVVYTINDGRQTDEYQHASGTLEIESATFEGDVLHVVGAAKGTLANTKNDSDSTLNYEAKFNVRAPKH
ncbi:hypothetical protein [Orrella sp. 11846]|uniref:hypothetical protein n=1 Tax=Orrella sp. 11846 TaxID=3409913 RepID=UPI003B5BB0CD